MDIDPRGRPTVTAGSDNYFHVCRSVPTFQNLAKQNKFEVRIVIATVVTVGLAEWIIGSTSLVYFLSNRTTGKLENDGLFQFLPKKSFQRYT